MLYHASGEVVEFPEIRKSRYTKDFSWGFYCTNNIDQAKKWAKRNREYPKYLHKIVYELKMGIHLPLYHLFFNILLIKLVFIH